MTEPHSTSVPPQKQSAPLLPEKLAVWLLCTLAAVHVFVFSAALPFFNPTDEEFHLDLAVKYSQGHIPRALETFSDEARPAIILYGTSEYFHPPEDFPGGHYPLPPWLQPPEQVAPYLQANDEAGRRVRNHEASQPPLYYAVAGLWWRLGQICRFDEGFLLYLIRFSNIPYLMLSVWLGYEAARILFPERPFIRFGVPALLAVLPQSALYLVQNDALSPLCFGAVFVGLACWLRKDILTSRLAAATGLAIAATFLTKLSNLPFLAVAAVVIVFQVLRQARTGTLRATLPALTILVSCAGVPIVAWLIRNKLVFGDFTASAAKIQMLGWTHKPFSEWWSHPIFTPAGFWTFLSDLLAAFWLGEGVWHGHTQASPSLRGFYIFLSLTCLVLAMAGLWSRANTLNRLQRRGLWLSLGCVVAGIVFLGFLSIIYDFHDCVYPSRKYPYFASGRLLLGMAIPFLLLCIYGLDHLLMRMKNKWIRPLTLAGLILFMLITETVTNWPLFASAYNWFHI